VTATSLAVALFASGASHFAGGRADSHSLVAREVANAHVEHADPPVDSQVRYWKAKAIRRLVLLGRRERRLVHLLHKLRGSQTASRSAPRAHSVHSIICSVFGAHCSEALRVAWCESRMNVYARNGQYLGLFQFGSFARARYGFAWNAWAQARAAYRYFLDALHDPKTGHNGWAPWECRP
jgi:hypothetical protein